MSKLYCTIQRYANCRCQRSSEPIAIIIRTGFLTLRISTHLIGLGLLKVGIDKFIGPALRSIQDRDAPLLATVLEPVLKLLGDIAQTVASHPLGITIGIKEADYSLGLLERLNQSV
jgi:hypothetical protein